MSADRGVKRARIAAALWGGFLFLITSWPNPPQVRAGLFPIDKATHFVLYAVEAFLLSRSVRWEERRGFAWPRVLAIVGTMALWGMLDEVHQKWIPGRTMDAGDFGADVGGAAAGAAVSEGLSRRGRARSSSA